MLWQGLADLFLDTTAFNGHGTLAQALWAAVPVLHITRLSALSTSTYFMWQVLTLPLDRIGQRIGAAVVLSSSAPQVESSYLLHKVVLV